MSYKIVSNMGIYVVQYSKYSEDNKRKKIMSEFGRLCTLAYSPSACRLGSHYLEFALIIKRYRKNVYKDS